MKPCYTCKTRCNPCVTDRYMEIKLSKIKVEYITHAGNDLMVVNAARISFGKDKVELDEKDKKLIGYLADHQHYTPFEHNMLSVKIHCPMYISKQIMRHRTFAY